MGSDREYMIDEIPDSGLWIVGFQKQPAGLIDHRKESRAACICSRCFRVTASSRTKSYKTESQKASLNHQAEQPSMIKNSKNSHEIQEAPDKAGKTKTKSTRESRKIRDELATNRPKARNHEVRLYLSFRHES